ncbi:hypothetical protein GCM10023149_53200 [Mucilaginibacter gynuensis]|uniref:Restriction endonuclease n=1 Tax=Mucilaginibacter gynuensis TaxID=1302236 RepID=A0ABP8HMF4_9SPHI
MEGNIAATLRKELIRASSLPELIARHDINQAFNKSVVEYIRANDVKPLETLMVGNQKINPNTFFWIETTITFNGAPDAWEQFNYHGKKPSYFKCAIKLPEVGYTIEAKLNAEHMYTTSAIDQLSKMKRKFLFGYVQEVNGKIITVRVILIGDRVLHNDAMVLYETRSELNAHEIDEFRDMKKISYKNKSLDLEINRGIPERDVKKYLAEIISESDVDKDWGGEQSDLFTTHLHVDGERLRAAFVLKGPSKFHKMQMNDLGKNGDQIARLFDEPADIFILQHCHHISSAVIKTMDAFANQINRPRKYCIINGIDTLRILRAYKKLPEL